MPCVFANWRADAQRANAVWPLGRGGGKDALFVEHPVIGQIVLQDRGHDLAILQNIVGVIKFAVAQMRPADPQSGTIGDLFGQLVYRGHCIAHKGTFQHQILGLIAGYEHLGQCHHLRTRCTPLLPSVQRKRCIRVNRPQAGVKLGQSQAKRVGHSMLRSGVFPVLAGSRARESRQRCRTLVTPAVQALGYGLAIG